MKKLLCLLFPALTIASLESKAQTILFEDFTSVTTPALPAGWTNTFTALPGTTPEGWVTITATADYFFATIPTTPPHGQYAECTEYYHTGNHPADLTSPSFSLAGTTAPRLTFDFLFEGSHYYSGGFGYFEEGYIKISTDSGATWNYLDTLPVGGYWDHRSIDLSAYIGAPDCRISFEYNDSGGSLLGFLLSNVRVYNAVAYDLALTSVTPLPGVPNFATTAAGMTMGGVVTNLGLNTITDFTATYQGWAGSPAVTTFSGLSIAPTESYTFTCATPYVPFVLDSLPVTMWINTTSDTTSNNDTLVTGVTGVSHFPTKIPVAEEATATWCDACPYGIIAFDSLDHLVHTAASLIAVHCSISTPDPMADGWYYGWMMSQVPQYPYMLFDRKVKTTPNEVADLWNQHHMDFGYADINMSFMLTPSDTSVIVGVSIVPATNLHGTYRLALVLTEDFVHSDVTPSSWDQENVYSGTTSGTADGEYNFDALPNPVPATDMYYDHVDRIITPSVYGGLYFPTPMMAGTTYSHNFHVPLGYWWKTANMHAIALLIDSTTGYILNSANILFGPDSMNVPSALTTANELAKGEIVLSPNPATTALTISAPGRISTIAIMNVLGETVFTKAYDADRIRVDVAGLPSGTYLVKINGTEIRKFVKK